ncbi:MAG: hypothetical protein A3C90_04065 [Candidatus Magasanikbacteria bacterium RIFCSPHIGHO2_02_FULL_51_14]|uniref:Uncharacterized protein n=1 Tax=Candidatus Magasanikbacteria bacterium RIFCSPHIGHO2_02_FULL_51_14 TaxID=1798683 RepID=A0A1F6MDT0_9BACT|nr:MAG: hypothetical protein A3C90_04065 [Candidatus Magasanikbacteria bacterium RIFCSPHIGHO2_02_FULL_51_14]
MYKTIALEKYRFVFLAAAAVLLSLLFAPTAYGQVALGGACSATAPCATGLTCVASVCQTVAAGECDPETDPFCIEPISAETKLGTASLQVTITRIINVALSLLGVVAVVIILVGGFKWMLAGGNEEKSTEARKLIFAGIIGLAIILSAFAIARFVLQSLGTATGTEGF